MPIVVSAILGALVIKISFMFLCKPKVKGQGIKIVKWLLAFTSAWIVWWITCACIWGTKAGLAALLAYPITALACFFYTNYEIATATANSKGSEDVTYPRS